MNAVVFCNLRIIDGSGEPAYAGEVRVEGERIRQVVRDGTAAARDAADVVDAGGATLMPGLIEAHAHVSFADTPDLHSLGDIPPEEHVLLAATNARTYLDRGFTSLNS